MRKEALEKEAARVTKARIRRERSLKVSGVKEAEKATTQEAKLAPIAQSAERNRKSVERIEALSKITLHTDIHLGFVDTKKGAQELVGGVHYQDEHKHGSLTVFVKSEGIRDTVACDVSYEVAKGNIENDEIFVCSTRLTDRNKGRRPLFKALAVKRYLRKVDEKLDSLEETLVMFERAASDPIENPVIASRLDEIESMHGKQLSPTYQMGGVEM